MLCELIEYITGYAESNWLLEMNIIPNREIVSLIWYNNNWKFDSDIEFKSLQLEILFLNTLTKEVV